MSVSKTSRRSNGKINKKQQQVKISTSQFVDVEGLIADAIAKCRDEFLVEIAALKQEIIEIKSSQTFISSEYDSLKSEYDKLMKTNEHQEKEINALKENSAELAEKEIKDSAKIDAVEQYGRRQNLEFAGVPVVEGEDTNKLVIEIAKLIQVDVTPEQISTSHRLPARRKRNEEEVETPPPIIARFVNRDIRNKIFSNRKLTRNSDLETFSVKNTKNIFVNENLTKSRKRLLWEAKQKAKNAGFKFIWTVNGNIFVRKAEECNSIAIKTNADLQLIK